MGFARLLKRVFHYALPRYLMSRSWLVAQLKTLVDSTVDRPAHYRAGGNSSKHTNKGVSSRLQTVTTKLDIYRYSHYTEALLRAETITFHNSTALFSPLFPEKAINFYARLLPCTEVKEEWLERASSSALCSFFLCVFAAPRRKKYVRSEIVTIRAFFSIFSRDVKISRWEEHFRWIFHANWNFFSSPPDSYFSHFHLHHRRRHSTRNSQLWPKLA